MPGLVLVDSNVYIHLLRRGRDPVRTLGAWAEHRDLATCGMIRVEVLRGIRTLGIHRQLASFLDVLVDLSGTTQIWPNAAGLAWRLDRKGFVIPAPDLYIAACAIAAGADLLTDDRHFIHVPGLHLLHPEKELPGWT